MASPILPRPKVTLPRQQIPAHALVFEQGILARGVIFDATVVEIALFHDIRRKLPPLQQVFPSGRVRQIATVAYHFVPEERNLTQIKEDGIVRNNHCGRGFGRRTFAAALALQTYIHENSII